MLVSLGLLVAMSIPKLVVSGASNAVLRHLAKEFSGDRGRAAPRTVQRLEALAAIGSRSAAERLTWIQLGWGRNLEAETRLRSVPEADPLLWWSLGLSYWQEADIEGALRSWREFIRLQPRSLYYLLWDVQLRPAEHLAELIGVLEELAPLAVRQDPEYEFAYLLAGDTLSSEDPEGAEQWFRLAAERFPYDSEPWLHLAKLGVDRNRFEEARLHLARAWELGDNGPMSFALLARMLEIEGKGREALSWYAKAAEASDGAQEYMRLLRVACEKFGPTRDCKGNG